MRQTECLVINSTSLDSYASLFNCTTAHRASDLIALGLDAMSLAWSTVVQLVVPFNSDLQWGISQEYSFLFRHSDRFDFVFSLRCID